MKHRFAPLCRAALFAAVSIGWIAPPAAAPALAVAPPPLEAFFGLPNVRQPQLSPDGRMIGFLFPHEGRLALGVFNRATNEAKMIVRGRDESLLGFFWKGNDRLVFYADVGGNESFFLAATDVAGKRVVRLAESQIRDNSIAGATVSLLDSLRSDPDRILVRGYFAPEETANLTALNTDQVVARLNIRNKARSPLATLERDKFYRDFIADQSGRLRVQSRLEGNQLIWEQRDDDKGGWRRLAAHPFHGYAETWEPWRFAADGSHLYLLSREEHDRGALYALHLASGTRGEALFTPPEGEITGLIFSPDGQSLRGVTYEGARTHYHWFDAGRAALQGKLDNTFPGMDVRIVSASDDEQVMLVHVSSDRDPGAFLVLDLAAGSMSTFRRVRDLDPRLLQPMVPIHFTARDGLELHGYLTKPAGTEGRPGPLIILPHGGPFGVRDSWGFDAEVQFLVSRGYAVLQVNYRGSGGYGRSFINRGRHQWGRAMQDDLTDAVRWAIAAQHADPERVAIMGASYGGYAALAGVTLTPDLYRCAVNYVGAADLEITFKDRGDDAWDRPAAIDYQTQWVGPDRAYRAATSPLNHVAAIRVPTLHAYGVRDPRVKIDHWTRLEAELKRHGKRYVALEERNQGHGFRDEKASRSFYAAVEKFLAENLASIPAGRVDAGPLQILQQPARP